MKATSDEGGEGERRYCWRTGLVEQNDHERIDSGGMNLREQTIYRLVPLEVLRLRTKQLALFLDAIIEEMWAGWQSSGTTHRYTSQYALVIPFVLITV